MLSENASTQVGNGTQEVILGDTESQIKREGKNPSNIQTCIIAFHWYGGQRSRSLLVSLAELDPGASMLTESSILN